jgi:hypothetical protein
MDERALARAATRRGCIMSLAIGVAILLCVAGLCAATVLCAVGVP